MSLNVRASLALLFDRGDFDDSILSFSRPSTATYVDEQGRIQVAPADAPRLDYDPVTGELKGLLIEESRTNYVRNSSMLGAVVGVPGTLPTNWFEQNLNGAITREIVETGTEDGLDYVDVRFSGTATDTGYRLNFDGVNAISASPYDDISFSCYAKIIDSSGANVPEVRFIIVERDSGLSQLGVRTSDNRLSLLNGDKATRIVYERSLIEATTAYITCGLSIRFYGQTDFTIRLFAPQVEKGEVVTSYIPTSGASATRSADDCDIDGAEFTEFYNQDEGTLLLEYIVNDFGRSKIGVSLEGSVTDDLIRIGQVPNDTMYGQYGYTLIHSTAQSVSKTYKGAINYYDGTIKSFLNGALIGSENYTEGVQSNMKIGRGASSFYLNGHIKRVIYFPKALSDSLMEKLTSELTF